MIRKEQQRFSLRKYKVGVASVFLGTTLSFMLANGGAVKASELPTQPSSEEKTELVKKDSVSEDSSKKEEDVVENVATTELAETNKLEEGKAGSEAKTEEAKSEPVSSEKSEEVKSSTTEAEVANKETAKPVEKAEENKSAVSEGDKPKVRNRRATTEDAVSGDHNSKPVSVSTYLKDGETVDPTIQNPNGATVGSQTVPAGYARKEGDVYTFGIQDLTRFNERYNTNYYVRIYKNFSASTDSVVELIDKNTGAIVETKTITATSGVQQFSTTTAKSNSELTYQVDYQTSMAADKTVQPFLQTGYKVADRIASLVNSGHQLTPTEQALFDAVYAARTTTDVMNVVEPTYNGRTITDSNFKIPQVVTKSTYYKVVDKANPTYIASKTDTTVQDYEANGNEVELAKYTLTATEGQNFTASGKRQFAGYKLYQEAPADSMTGYASRPYVVGTKFMDAERAGIKRIKEIVGEDGSVVVRVYLLDPKQQSKRSDGSLSTDGYMLLAETKPIKPGKVNTEDLVVQKTPLYTIPFTTTNGVNYPNGKETPFGFQTASGYTPKKTVFVPFLGDNIGHLSPNSQLERGNFGIGTNVDLLNGLTPYTETVFYYEKVDPVTYTPEVSKVLEGRTLNDGDFSFTLKQEGGSHQETVTNKNGKATFSELTFEKPGTYTYKITEVAGSDKDVDYDGMEVTLTITVTQNAQDKLEVQAVYQSTGGHAEGENDKVFNNYVVAPVKVKFDFTKKLAGRELKDGEFNFVLKDSRGQEVETVANKKDGTVTFTELSFDNTKIGTHTYTVEEVIPATKELGMTYDTMKATLTVEVAKNGHTLTTVTNVSSAGGVDDNGASTDGTEDKVFNNKITPPETPVFQPEKFVLNKEKYDITGTKLVDDDHELTNEYTDTNADPYADKTTNNEAENINTKTVERGEKLVYQVWLDTRNFSDKNNIQSVAISDTYDAEKVTVNAADIKAYDSVTGQDVTAKFDIKVENGVITATSKASMNKSLGDVDNTQVIDTTKFEFGRYYKFDIPATVKADVKAGADIENKANQIVHVYNPVSKSVETPEKPTQKRVNSVPVTVDLKFTKKLEGRTLAAGEFSFVLKKDNVAVETVKNDKDGKITFKTLKFGKDDLGKTYTYTVSEVAGTDTTVTYDDMVATVTVKVAHDGTAKAIVATVTDAPDKEFNNTVTPPEEPKFQPEKYVVTEEKYSITDNKLLDDDSELADKYGDTNKDPYADKTDNNEAQNLNTKTVKPGAKLVYQVWLDTTKFDANNKDNIQSVSISDDFDETKVDVDASAIKAYDSVTGDDVTNKFEIKVENGVMTATLKAGFTKSLGDADNTQIIDTTKFEFGRYYKFDIPATVKTDVEGGVDIENTAAQIVNYYNPSTKKVEKPEKPTEKRVNSVPIEVEFNFTKKLEGRELKAGEFSFVLKDSKGTEIETVQNDKDGNVKFKAIEYKKGEEGTYKYTIEEVKGSDATVTYDSMKAEITVEVEHDGKAKALVKTVTDAPDTEFNNTVTPPETPEFNPEKYILNEEKFDITGTKLLDDDKELTDKVADTNKDPYADKVDNNEAQNINTQTLHKGDKVVYQVWLDTTKFTEAHNIQSVGITDKYDSENLDVNVADIKAYDSVTGEDVTAKFDISIVDGVITATSKAELTKSLGDAENTQVIDTAKLAFGRYYKFDILARIKDTAKEGVDIENTASQIVHQYDPTKKSVEKPEKPTEKRVVNIPVKVEFNFTKKLEGRALKAGEFTFVLKDKDGNVIETVSNDAEGKIKFSALEFKRGQEGTYIYHVEEVQGTEAGVEYDKMVATVGVTVTKDGKVLTLTSQMPEDTEFNNKVTPPTPLTPPTPEKPKGRELPNTGEQSKVGLVALGAALGLVGLGLIAKPKRRED